MDKQDNQELDSNWQNYEDNTSLNNGVSRREVIIDEARRRNTLLMEDQRAKREKRLLKQNENRIIFNQRVRATEFTDKASTNPSPRCKKEQLQEEEFDPPVVLVSTPPLTKKRKDPPQSHHKYSSSSTPATIATVESSSSYSSVSSPAARTPTIAERNAAVRLKNNDCVPQCLKMTICSGCNKLYGECSERRYKKICLQAVVDFFQDIGGEKHATGRAIERVYRLAYMAQVRSDIMRKTGYYETDRDLRIPLCMEFGSLSDALIMNSDSPLYQALNQMRLFSVEEYLILEESEKQFAREEHCRQQKEGGEDS